MASVLAVVAGSPAQAANTSQEALVDHDNDASTATVREFGGRDRYDTALRLAKDFAEGKGGIGTVPTAFLASGLSLVDAVSVSGLAGFMDAPVLLTESDSLHGGVADFIEDYGIDSIYVLGGSAAVADSVLEAIEMLANEPKVERIAGSDRYATSAAVASRLGGGAAWCGGEDAAAILVNGGDVSLAEAMMVGPIAHRLQLPVLMTTADELPGATIDFIETEDIEHIVIVGGTEGVSEDVADAVNDAGVDTVTRIAGDSAGATSVELAKLLTGDCKDDLAPLSVDIVALVNRDALPDGVAAAPVLSSNSDLAKGNLIPILIVGDTLPASVRDYLAATPEATDAGKLDLKIVAIGGTAAVSDSVMQAALSAAASADALSVQIGTGGKAATTDPAADAVDPVDINKDEKVDGNDAPQVGDTRVSLYFSDNVEGNDADTDGDELENAIRDILLLNGAPARLSAVDHGRGTNAACDADVVTVTLSTALKAGDTISIAGGAKLGSSGDQRAVGATSRTVAAPALDRARPTVHVILIAGQPTANITISKETPLITALEDDATVKLRRAAGGEEEDVTPAAGGLELAFDPALEAGDRITISSGAVVDGSKNQSLQRSFTAIVAQKSPRITSVLMSNLNHTANAATRVPEALTGGAGTPPDDGDDSTIGDLSTDAPDIWILAKGDGAAAGAAGNDWSVTFDRASTYNAEKDLDIDVRVSSRDKSVFVRFNNGKAKFADLKAALEARSAFDALFEVKVDADPTSVEGGACGKPANSNLAIKDLVRGADGSTADPAGGVTKVAIQVTFNGYINAVEHTELLTDVLKATLGRAVDDGAVTDEGAIMAKDNFPAVFAALELPPAEQHAIVGPTLKHTYSATAMNAVMLPQVRDLVVTAGNVDLDDPETTVVENSKEVALGYAANEDPATLADGENVNVNKNGPSRVFIGRSSGVEAPK